MLDNRTNTLSNSVSSINASLSTLSNTLNSVQSSIGPVDSQYLDKFSTNGQAWPLRTAISNTNETASLAAKYLIPPNPDHLPLAKQIGTIRHNNKNSVLLDEVHINRSTAYQLSIDGGVLEYNTIRAPGIYLYNSSGQLDDGAPGQVLASNGWRPEWVDPSTLITMPNKLTYLSIIPVYPPASGTYWQTFIDLTH